MRTVQRTSGFTLIELSIVLVIIGLIVGGVLVGQDLIKVAEIRATVRQVEQFDTAVNVFQGKYDCLPGDCLNGQTRFGFVDYGYNGGPDNADGDDEISAMNINSLQEDWYAVHQLYDTHLIPTLAIWAPGSGDGVLTALPTSDSSGVRGYWIIEYNSGAALDYSGAHHNITTQSGHYYWMSDAYTTAGYPAVIAPIDAFAIDSKMDDGFPESGNVLATSAVNGEGFDTLTQPISMIALFDAADDAGAAGAHSNFCVTSTPFTYNVRNVSRAAGSLCLMVVKSSF